MIVSKDGRVIVVTPSRTAGYTLESLAKKSGNYRILQPRQSVTAYGYLVTQEPEAILMPIRNPYTRLESIYRHGRKTRHPTILRWASAEYPDLGPTFASFVHQWADNVRAMSKWQEGAPYSLGRHWVWITRYSDYVHACGRDYQRAPEVFPLENRGIRALLKRMGLPREDKWLAATEKARKSLWTPMLKDSVHDVLSDDLVLGGYK